MPTSPPGTLELIARELGLALEPLGELMGPDLLTSLGLQLPEAFRTRPALVSAFEQGGDLAKALPPLVQDLSTAIENDDTGETVTVGVKLIQKLVKLIQAFKQIGDTLGSEANAFVFSPGEKAELNQFAEQFALRLLNYMLVTYLEDKSPVLVESLGMIGLAENYPQEASSSVETPYVRKMIHPDKLLALFQDPEQHLGQLYQWGQPGFNGEALFIRLKQLLDQLKVPTDLYPLGPNYELEAYLFHLRPDTGQTPPGLEIELRVPGQQNIEKEIPLIAPWSALLKAEGSFEAGVSATLSPGGQLSLNPPSGQLNLLTEFGLKAERPERPLMFIGQTGGSRQSVR